MIGFYIMFTRLQTHKVLVGDVQIGHQNKVVIQSMTNTKTSNVIPTINQIKELVKHGAQLVRVAVLDQSDALALKQITKLSPCPIIADIHYNYRLAIIAIQNGVAKIRINPANIDLDHLQEIVKTAKAHQVAIRIGINQGSKLNQRSFATPKAMINCALKFIKLFENWNFHAIIVSLKSSQPLLTNILYQQAAQKIKYPLHLGVTEAGTLTNATIKNTIGLVPLLQKGIGDTIRVSISDHPITEVVVAKKILSNLGLYKNIVNIIACPTCGRLQ
jgi:(E)-4-hydroxy-3-methylbut-2-enyl-diphosphate synthase